MGEEKPNFSLVNLGDLSKPADTLIKKVSKAVGGIFAPYQLKRMANAEAEAAMIRAQNEIEITDLHRRAMHRFIAEEATRQQNIELITCKALPQLSAGADASTVEDDWVTNFFDKCRIVSDDEMQNLWSRVLAGEANKPGTYSKRTVNFLADLDKTDAEMFKALCGFGWTIAKTCPLVFEEQDAIYNRHGVTFHVISHLASIGLIQQQTSLGSFGYGGLPKRFRIHYYGRPLDLVMPNDANNELDVGRVLLTRIGQELAPISGSAPVDGFWEFILQRWAKYLPKTEPAPPAHPSPAAPPASAG